MGTADLWCWPVLSRDRITEAKSVGLLHCLAPDGTEYENANPFFKYMRNGGLL